MGRAREPTSYEPGTQRQQELPQPSILHPIHPSDAVPGATEFQQLLSTYTLPIPTQSLEPQQRRLAVLEVRTVQEPVAQLVYRVDGRLGSSGSAEGGVALRQRGEHGVGGGMLA
jgi:hypothetical protein